jgi:TM2 domain-containing membrane protein YozV
MTEATTKTCPSCAETILAAAKKCKHCGEFLDRPTAYASYAVSDEPQGNGTAAVLSFFVPGLGQIYKGQIRNGIFWLLGYGVTLSIALVIWPVGAILALAYAIVCVVKAYQPVEQEQPMPDDYPTHQYLSDDSGSTNTKILDLD